jgi:hypothetical protein
MTLQRTLFRGPLVPKQARPRMCRVCHDHFLPNRPMQRACGIECAKTLAVAAREKAEKRRAVKERQADRERKAKLKTRSDWQKEAQAVFNAFIRARDAAKPCICCGLPLSAGDVGGKFDCGHYRSTGSAPHLRFEENNAHGQRKQCNRWGAGRAVDYRIGLIARIGRDAVEALEADQAPRHYSIDDLKAIKALYTAKRRELGKANS